MRKAITNFLDRDWDEIADKIVKSPYVRSISKTPDKFPSYIPSDSFSQSIIDVIKGTEDLPESIPEIRKQIRTIMKEPQWQRQKNYLVNACLFEETEAR